MSEHSFVSSATKPSWTQRAFTRHRLARGAVGIAAAVALGVGGSMSAGPLAAAAPAPGPLGASGHTSPGANIYVPNPTINHTRTGGAAPGRWAPELPVAVGNVAGDTLVPSPNPAPGPAGNGGAGASSGGSTGGSGGTGGGGTGGGGTGGGGAGPQGPAGPVSPASPTGAVHPAVYSGSGTAQASTTNGQTAAIQPALSASTPAAKPGLGLQSYYPVERKQINDRMELDIDTANGNVVVRYRDLSFNGLGLNTSVDHVFNDQASNTGAFGKRWTMSAGRDVGLDLSNPSSIVFQGPTGYQQTYTSNGSGGYTSPKGANTTFTKNGDGTYTIMQSDGSKQKWNFDAGGNLTSQVDKNNNKLTYNYNGDGTLACITDARGAVTQFTGYSAGKVTSFTDPTGASYGPFHYDANNQLTDFTDRGGNKISYGYDAAGNLTSITDPNGNTYTLGYDASRRITSLAEPNGTTPATTTFAYPTGGQTNETDANGHTTQYFFDSDGKQTKATDPLGHSQSKTYTANFNVATTSDGMNNSSTASYDANNNLVGTQLPTGAKTAVGYTDAANPNAPTTGTDMQGNQYSFTYDAAGNPLTAKSVTANITAVTRTYNANGTVKDSTDGTGNKTSYTYDTQGRLITVNRPLPLQPVHYTYDSLSRITSVTDGNGTEIDYSYDQFDRVTQVAQKTATGQTVLQQTAFDKNGNKTNNYYGPTTTTFAYNPRNVVTSATKQSGLGTADSTSYAYDPVGNLTSYKDAGGTVAYAFDAANNLTKLTDPTNAVTTFAYDNDNHRTSTTFPNNTNIQTAYDKSGRVTSESLNGPNAQWLANTYSYTAANGSDSGILTKERNAQYQTLDLSYDGMNRLTTAQIEGGGTYYYAYDASGNLTSSEGSNLTNNTAEQLTKFGGTTLTYDGQGNQTGDSTGRAMTYSPTDQVTHTNDPGTGAYTGSVDTTYNSVDQTQRNRITTTPNGAGATPTTTDVTNSALGITGLTVNGTQRTTAFRDPKGNLIGYKDPSGAVHYTATDFQRTTLASTGPGSTGIDAKYQYSPYGRYINAQGAASGLNNFLYAGGLRTLNDHQDQFGVRTYDAIQGRFTQPDPIGTPASGGSGQDSRSGIGGPYSADGNPYVYAGDNPAVNGDPTGNYSSCQSLGIALGIVGAISFGILLFGTGLGEFSLGLFALDEATESSVSLYGGISGVAGLGTSIFC